MKRLLATALLLALPFAQAKAVVVCAMAQAPIVDDCVCPHAHARHAGATDRDDRDASDDGCCTVDFAPSDEPAALAVPKPSPQCATADRSDESPMPVAVDTPDAVPARYAAERLATPRVCHVPDQHRLYLSTARLRL